MKLKVTNDQFSSAQTTKHLTSADSETMGRSFAYHLTFVKLPIALCSSLAFFLAPSTTSLVTMMTRMPNSRAFAKKDFMEEPDLLVETAEWASPAHVGSVKLVSDAAEEINLVEDLITEHIQHLCVVLESTKTVIPTQDKTLWNEILRLKERAALGCAQSVTYLWNTSPGQGQRQQFVTSTRRRRTRGYAGISTLFRRPCPTWRPVQAANHCNPFSRELGEEFHSCQLRYDFLAIFQALRSFTFAEVPVLKTNTSHPKQRNSTKAIVRGRASMSFPTVDGGGLASDMLTAVHEHRLCRAQTISRFARDMSREAGRYASMSKALGKGHLTPNIFRSFMTIYKQVASINSLLHHGVAKSKFRVLFTHPISLLMALVTRRVHHDHTEGHEFSLSSTANAFSWGVHPLQLSARLAAHLNDVERTCSWMSGDRTFAASPYVWDVVIPSSKLKLDCTLHLTKVPEFYPTWSTCIEILASIAP
ncbi:hypothetical protein EV421DRAFT_1746294 [Armillaria borealis]|uniref:Uncharacterized protein n=1 Tax=Armillaria borealis TaxID=47425 RepID=A0AA39IC71_9AGAR|nr:hypothetical protein EV421DRAFT_1746294 [Armillaria borealis]